MVATRCQGVRTLVVCCGVLSVRLGGTLAFQVGFAQCQLSGSVWHVSHCSVQAVENDPRLPRWSDPWLEGITVQGNPRLWGPSLVGSAGPILAAVFWSVLWLTFGPKFSRHLAKPCAATLGSFVYRARSALVKILKRYMIFPRWRYMISPR